MRQSLVKILTDYRRLFEKGENLSVIDLFYADDIEQIENDEVPVKGKIAIKELEKINLDGVHGFEQRIVSLVIDEEKGTVMGEMQISFDSKKHGRRRLHEAFVQHWKDDKIVYQKFYYKSFINNNDK